MHDAALDTQLSTTSEDYGQWYFAHHLGSAEDYSWDSQHWRTFFSGIADRLVAIANPANALDVGCAKGLLVQALVERGVDAYGSDISSHAIESAHHAVRSRLSVASAVDAIPGNWDLVACIEVLEHIGREHAELALDNICAVTRRVLFSSSPEDFTEPTHINVHQPAEWGAAFAERGFFRRTDVDVSFVTPWAVLFEKAPLEIRDLAYRYEAIVYPMRAEIIEKRAALLDAHRTISTLTDVTAAPEAEETKSDDAPAVLGQQILGLREDLADVAEERDTLAAALDTSAARLSEVQDQLSETKARLMSAEHRLLTVRDHVIGAEATASTAIADRDRALVALEAAKVEFDYRYHQVGGIAHDLSLQLNEILTSERWRASGIALSPLAGLKRLAQKGKA